MKRLILIKHFVLNHVFKMIMYSGPCLVTIRKKKKINKKRKSAFGNDGFNVIIFC